MHSIRAKEREVDNIYSDIRSETKKRPSRPSAAASAAQEVEMEDNELYGSGD